MTSTCMERICPNCSEASERESARPPYLRENLSLIILSACCMVWPLR